MLLASFNFRSWPVPLWYTQGTPCLFVCHIPRGMTTFRVEWPHSAWNDHFPRGMTTFRVEWSYSTWNDHIPRGMITFWPHSAWNDHIPWPHSAWNDHIPRGITTFRVEWPHSAWNNHIPLGMTTFRVEWSHSAWNDHGCATSKLVCKQNSLHFHSFSVGILFNSGEFKKRIQDVATYFIISKRGISCFD